MLSFLTPLLLSSCTLPSICLEPPVSLAQNAQPEQQQPEQIIRPQTVRPLPGKLDNIPVFNSNSPEMVLEEGILLSTFPSAGKKTPKAHLNFAFNGRFDLFAHHINRSEPDNIRTLYLGVLMHNPSRKTVRLQALSGASYESQPDAPFIELPPQLENQNGNVYAGPGSRVMSDIIRGKLQRKFSPQSFIPPQQSQMLLNMPITVKGLTPPLNGRSTYLRLKSNGKLYIASLAMYAPLDEDGNECPPTLEEWETLLKSGDFAKPRDAAPTPPHSKEGAFRYGRVAGVARGSVWQAKLTDKPGGEGLTIPKTGEAVSFAVSTVDRGTLGTNQIQSAPMLARYPDTAYKAHGNYGIEYDLDVPLYNPTDKPQSVSIALETPIKQDQLSGGLRFFEPLPKQTFFRGTVKVEYPDEKGNNQLRYYHLVQRRGQQGNALATVTIPPKKIRTVKVNFLYPPDATPPQVLTIFTQ